MDALKLLSDQHKEVKALFGKIEKAKDPQKAGQLFTELKTALTLHEKIEETHFYPPLREEAKTEDLVLESYEEHHVMDLLLEEISRVDPGSEQFHPKMKVLEENVLHHAEEEEEGKLFPKVRQIWNAARRKEIGAKMEASAAGSRSQRSRAAA